MFHLRLAKLLSLLVLLSPLQLAPGEQAGGPRVKFPYPEKLTYRIEWRLITAGSARVELMNSGSNQWQTSLNIESAGMMTRLYKVADIYKTVSDTKFCAVNSNFEEEEGKRRTQIRMSFEALHHRLKYDEQDLVKNIGKHSEIDIPSCAYDILGAFTAMRILAIEPGKATTLPITNGKKLANARIESQAKENIKLDGKSYQTVRYEAYLFDNVLYRRKGRLLIWLTDDGEHLPVQIRLQMGFPIGNVSILLEKEGRL